MRISCAWLIAMICCLSEGNAAEAQADGWRTAVLWNSDVVSARLLFKPSASLADKTLAGPGIGESHAEAPRVRANVDESGHDSKGDSLGQGSDYERVKWYLPLNQDTASGPPSLLRRRTRVRLANMGLPPDDRAVRRGSGESRHRDNGRKAL